MCWPGIRDSAPSSVRGAGVAKTSIIGIDRDKCLIIRPPALVGIEAKLFKKNQTVVRYFHDGMIFGFRCTLIGFIKIPFPLLILSYPDAAEQLNLRKHKRLSCLLNGQLWADKVPIKSSFWTSVLPDAGLPFPIQPDWTRCATAWAALSRLQWI